MDEQEFKGRTKVPVLRIIHLTDYLPNSDNIFSSQLLHLHISTANNAALVMSGSVKNLCSKQIQY